MTIQQPPIFMQSESHPAEDVRRMFTYLTGGKTGVFGLSDFAVTQTGTPSMGVAVAGGGAMVKGNDAPSTQGSYFVENRGSTNLSITAANPTNARRDLIILRVSDADYSGVVNEAELQVVTGTAAASPSDPAVSGTYILLARVAVAAGATSITNANITDLRFSGGLTAQKGTVVAAGGTTVCSTANRPTSPAVGTKIYDTTVGREMIYSATSGWTLTAPLYLGTYAFDHSGGCSLSWVLVQNRDNTLGTAPCHGTLLSRFVGRAGFRSGDLATDTALTNNGTDTAGLNYQSWNPGYAHSGLYHPVTVELRQTFSAGNNMGYRVYRKSNQTTGDHYLQGIVSSIFYPNA